LPKIITLKKNETILVALLAALNFTHILDFMIMMPLGNLLMPRWHINSSQFTLVVSCYSFASFISSFCAIFFADKFDRKNLLLLAYAGFLIGTLTCAVADSYHTMMAARLITGLFGGLISAQVLSIIGDVIPYERRGQAMGMLMGGFGLASIVGIPLGLYFANTFGWYSPFIFIVAVGGLVFPFLLKYIPNVNAHLANQINFMQRLKNIGLTFKNETQLTALLFSAVMMMGHFIIIPLLNPYMVHNVGVPLNQTPLIYLVGGLSSIVTAQIAGKLADKYGKKKVFTIAAYVSIVFVWLITNLPVTNIVLVLVLFAFWFSTATSRMVPGQAMTTQAVPPQNRGGFMSLNSCVQSLGQAFVMLISGWVTYSDNNLVIHHYAALGYISIALILLCVIIVSRLEKLILADM
jgi:MFS transporter, DHA1 family, inner membrane transport protein